MEDPIISLRLIDLGNVSPDPRSNILVFFQDFFGNNIIEPINLQRLIEGGELILGPSVIPITAQLTSNFFEDLNFEYAMCLYLNKEDSKNSWIGCLIYFSKYSDGKSFLRMMSKENPTFFTTIFLSSKFIDNSFKRSR